MAIELTEKQIQDGWQVVKFGEIAKECKSTTKNALEDGLEFYVGLDHLDPQSLRITRKGVIADDNPTFTRKFAPGQILFGKRRCYQKKTAVADFEGICSGDIIVIEAIAGKIIPELLPFIVQSNMFFDWAEKTSSGSLSPRTKWKSLAEFEFPLPPKERQKEILELLEKVEENIDNNSKALIAAKELRHSGRAQVLFKGSNKQQLEKTHLGVVPKGWKSYPLDKIAQINPSYKIEKGKPVTFCEMASVGDDSQFIEGATEVRENVSGGSRFMNGDILFARITPCAENGKITTVDFLKEGEVGVGSTEFIVLSPRKVSSNYLYHLCRTTRVHGYAIKRMAGTTGRQRIPNEVFGDISVPYPPASDLPKLEQVLNSLESEVVSLKASLSGKLALKSKVFNKFWRE